MNKLRNIIILLIIIIIVIIIMLFKLLDYSENEITIYEEDSSKIEKIEKDTSKYEIYNCISQYIEYQYENDLEKIKSICGNYNENNINYELKEENLIQLEEAYIITKNEGATIYSNVEINNKNVYFIINIDYNNNTFIIINSAQEEYNNAKANIVDQKYREKIEIEKNQYNEFKICTEISEQKIIKEYFEKYKNLVLKNQEMAFELLDEEYKEKRFNNDFKQYEDYVKKSKELIEETNILKYNKEQEENNNKYVIRDNFNNTYIIKEYGYMNYKILLDSYTISVEEINEANIEEILRNNITHVFEMISNRDYEKLYSLLDNTFRENNFNTIDKFKTYIDKEFFETNLLGKITVSKKAQVYIIDVSYKERASAAAEEREKKILMKLLSGTDFVMSFSMD